MLGFANSFLFLTLHYPPALGYSPDLFCLALIFGHVVLVLRRFGARVVFCCLLVWEFYRESCVHWLL